MIEQFIFIEKNNKQLDHHRDGAQPRKGLVLLIPYFSNFFVRFSRRKRVMSTKNQCGQLSSTGIMEFTRHGYHAATTKKWTTHSTVDRGAPCNKRAHFRLRRGVRIGSAVVGEGRIMARIE